MTAGLFALTIGVAGLFASGLQAQDIPMPFSDNAEARHIAVVVTPGRKSMRGLSETLINLRKRMHAGQEVPAQGLRKLADAGDGLAAQLYVRAMIAGGEHLTRPSDLAYYAAIAVGTGRIWTLSDMVEAMARLDPDAEPRARIRKYIQVLYPHAWAGNTRALDAVIEFNGEGKLFGALSQSTRDRIEAQGRQNADGRVELRMAMGLLERRPTSEADKGKARALLQQAQKSGHLGIRTTAENLLALMDQRDAVDG